MARFTVEMTFDVYNPKDWKFKVQTTEKLKNVLENIFLIFRSFWKKIVKIGGRQTKV